MLMGRIARLGNQLIVKVRFNDRYLTLVRHLHPAKDPGALLETKAKDAEIFGPDWKNWLEKEEQAPDCLYPALKLLNPQTENRSHKLEVTCDSVLRYIRFGAINVNMAVQYCHYLADLSRTALKEEDASYYAKRCFDLMNFLIRKDLPDLTKFQLFCDVADTGPQACERICNQILNDKKLYAALKPRFIHRIIMSAYKYQWWSLANRLISLEPDGRNTSPRICDTFVLALKQAAANYNDSLLDVKQREELKGTVVEHMMNMFEKNYLARVQFITKYKMEFMQALDDFGFKVVKNPTIKNTGRCTRCNNRLPLFDKSLIPQLNKAIRELIFAGEENDLLLNTTKQEVEEFENFLERLDTLDKRPIDIVIDGLNIAYRNHRSVVHTKKILQDVEVTTKTGRSDGYTNVLINTLIRNDILTVHKKIVIIGKRHMTRWPGLLDFFDEQKIHYFLLSNATKDDLFQLYAATLNHRTLLLTDDYFRDHLFNLEPAHKIILARWIDTHQACMTQKSLRIAWPTPYEKIPSVDRESGLIHVPIVDYGKLDCATHGYPVHLNTQITSWICCSTDPSKLPKKSDGNIFMNSQNSVQ